MLRLHDTYVTAAVYCTLVMFVLSLHVVGVLVLLLWLFVLPSCMPFSAFDVVLSVLLMRVILPHVLFVSLVLPLFIRGMPPFLFILYMMLSFVFACYTTLTPLFPHMSSQ